MNLQRKASQRRWGVHACGKLSRDKVCREYGVARIHIRTPTHNVGIAVTPGSRFASGRLVNGKFLDDGSKWVRVVRDPT